ncbi:heat-inducible transcription repressor HrcA [bacterium]|nr:heat-inducible transcription repressor HrcA [bacterium]
MNELTKRQINILRWLIRSYVKDAIPVASAQLARKKGLDCCAATIRNELTALEDQGYIQQPHTSAGRIPTDLGYRFYVDNLVKPEPVDLHKHAEIFECMEEAQGDVRKILAEASRVLGLISQELGVVLTPYLSWSLFDRMELISLSFNKVLAVLHVRSRMVKTVILELDSELVQKDLDRAASLLNERLSGLTLIEIQRSIADRVSDVGGIYTQLVRLIALSADALFNFTEPLDIHTSGTKNIVSHPEFQQAGPLQDIFTIIDDRRHLIKLFHASRPEITVAIGEENSDLRLRHFSVVTCSYKRGPDVGRLGVIGPRRMPYNRIIPLVETMAETMSQYLS